jgi:hypothetical protein
MRNLDYHKNDHPTYEGDSVKKMLLSMIRNAKDLYNNLEDTDDLPEWISSELSKSNYITSKTKDYIISKLEKKCMDGNLAESELKLIINNHLISESINENLYKKIKSFIKPKKNKKSFSSNLYKKEFDKSLDSNYLLDSLKMIKKLTYNINFAIQSFRYNEHNKNSFFTVNEDHLSEIKNFLIEVLNLINSKNYKPTTTSARKKKKKSITNLFGLIESQTKEIFSKRLDAINQIILYLRTIVVNHPVLFNTYDSRIAYVEELLEKFNEGEVKKEIQSMIKQIENFEKLIQQVKTME